MVPNADISSICKPTRQRAGENTRKMKQLKLEVGKTYRSRSGEDVRITEFYKGAQYPYRGNKGKWYAESGQWCNRESPADLIAEVPETRHTFAIPDGVKELTVEQVGNRIVVEMVPEAKEPKPGDIMVNEHDSVYIFKSVIDSGTHSHYAWLDESGCLVIAECCYPGRPATPEEAQPLWDALKKAGKRWNPETMGVENVPEIDRIREWVEENIKDGYYNQEDVAEAIEGYLKQKEDKQ